MLEKLHVCHVYLEVHVAGTRMMSNDGGEPRFACSTCTLLPPALTPRETATMTQSIVTGLILLFAGAHLPGPAHLVEAFSRSTPPRRQSAFRSSCRDREHSQQCLRVGGKALFASTNGDSGALIPEEEDGYESEERQIAKQGFYIRRGLFKDLRCVADLMMDAFYFEKSVMYHYHRMLELDRVQNNFPYDSSKHEYYVACSPDGKVIGFVDIDARPSARKDAPPRPYLSDLAVSSEWRRKGIASRLVEQCEARTRSMGKSKMYLRVEQKNEAALRMYCENMAYEKRQHPVFGVKDTTILLRCDLQERLKMTKTGEKEAGSTCDGSEDIVLDYQV